MPAQVIDGRAIAARIREALRGEAERQRGRDLTLASIQVGDHPASELYIRNQRRACAAFGIKYEEQRLPATATEAQVLARIWDLNEDPDITGIIVQRPLPRGIDRERIQSAVHPDKDVEGLNPANIGMLFYEQPNLAPCTAVSAVTLARSTGVALAGKEAVVVGHSEIVGKPIAIILLNEFATATICHAQTRDLAAHTREADVLFVAVGRPGLITGDMVKPGAIVVDIGINLVPDPAAPSGMRVVGDVDFAGAREVAGHLTPVPGGVGPVTVAVLLQNIFRAARYHGFRLG
jgi:methylenetetrahydrofolate dehydrogenase (NADP+)/methenyltetrahydrofolate cyclohydrolase